uniref:Uncharacterized protein n=1 Tax=Arundo donax TaxID=35708 RepID=A0A0A8Y1F6_ARUDO
MMTFDHEAQVVFLVNSQCLF